jgi:hypothetical protein
MERLLTSDGIEEELSEYHLRFEDERSRRRMAEGISANAPKLFAMLIYLRKGHTICDFVQEGIGDSHLPFERDDKTTKTGDFKLCRQHRPKEPIQCMLDWDRDDIIHFERDQWCTRAPIFSYTEGVEHYEFEQNLVLPFIIDHEHSDHVKNAGFSRVWKVVIHHAHQKLFENAFAKVRAHHACNFPDFHSTKDPDCFGNEQSSFDGSTIQMSSPCPNMRILQISALCSWKLPEPDGACLLEQMVTC